MFNESPFIQEILEEARVKTLRNGHAEPGNAFYVNLAERFRNLPPQTVELLHAVADERRLRDLVLGSRGAVRLPRRLPGALI